MKTKRRKRNNSAGDLVPVASKPASAAPKVKATAADPFVDGLSKGMGELDGGTNIGPRTAASPAAAAKNTDALVSVLDTTAPVSRQPVIKPVEFPKYTRNAVGDIVPVEAGTQPSKPTLVKEKDSFITGLDDGMKDLPEVKDAGPEGIDYAAEGGKAGGEGEYLSIVNITNNGIAKKTITKFKFKPSSGVNLEATSSKTTTILGNYKQDMQFIVDELGNVKSTDFGTNSGGFNVLNTPDELYMSPEQFWEEYNRPWLDIAIQRGDDIILATKPERRFLSYTDKITGEEVLTGFGREFKYLLKNRYVYDAATNMMIRK